MTKATKQLSGPGKDKFFRRFFDEEQTLEPEVARQLAEKSAKTFSSVRVRGAAFDAQRAAEAKAKISRPVVIAQAPKKSKPAKAGAADVDAAKQPVTDPARPPTSQASPPQASPPEAPAVSQPDTTAKAVPAFDAYSFGLVPTCQREGADGLMTKLSDIATAENLREMAKAQRIVIPAGLRTGDADPQLIREAIVAAVAKSIADKKAAAG